MGEESLGLLHFIRALSSFGGIEKTSKRRGVGKLN